MTPFVTGVTLPVCAALATAVPVLALYVKVVAEGTDKIMAVGLSIFASTVPDVATFTVCPTTKL